MSIDIRSKNERIQLQMVNPFTKYFKTRVRFYSIIQLETMAIKPPCKSWICIKPLRICHLLKFYTKFSQWWIGFPKSMFSSKTSNPESTPIPAPAPIKIESASWIIFLHDAILAERFIILFLRSDFWFEYRIFDMFLLHRLLI